MTLVLSLWFCPVDWKQQVFHIYHSHSNSSLSWTLSSLCFPCKVLLASLTMSVWATFYARPRDKFPYCILCTQNYGDKGRLGSHSAGNRRQFHSWIDTNRWIKKEWRSRRGWNTCCLGGWVEEAAAYDLAAGRVKVKRWPASSSRPFLLLPTTQPAHHQLLGQCWLTNLPPFAFPNVPLKAVRYSELSENVDSTLLYLCLHCTIKNGGIWIPCKCYSLIMTTPFEQCTLASKPPLYVVQCTHP